MKLSRCDIRTSDFVRACTHAERILAQQMHKDTRTFVPMLTGVFDRNSRVIGNIIEYRGDQANYLWHGVKMINKATGAGPMIIPGVGPRWPKGAQLVPTRAPINYTKDFHPLAGDHWMDRSERANGKRWTKTAEEAVAHGFDKY